MIYKSIITTYIMLFIIFPDVHLKILGDAMDEEKFKGALKGSLNAAKDWEGGRALRRG